MSHGLRLAGHAFEAMAFIVASCSPRTHEPMFQETVRQAGLNKYLFEMANIRDQCSWIHMKQKGEATDKAKDLVRPAVANARLIKPLEEVGLPVTHKALVIGGGVAGMTSALKIADQGYEVFLLEKENQPGGNIRNLHYILEEKQAEEGIKICMEIIQQLKEIKGARGVHIMAIEWEQKVAEIAKAAGLLPRP